MKRGKRRRDGGLPKYFGARKTTFPGLKIILEREKLHFLGLKLFWSARNYIFSASKLFWRLKMRRGDLSGPGRRGTAI